MPLHSIPPIACFSVDGVPATVFRAAFQSILQGLHFAQLKILRSIPCIVLRASLAATCNQSIQLFPLELKRVRATVFRAMSHSILRGIYFVLIKLGDSALHRFACIASVKFC
jgi:hypothetical protein